MYVDFVSNAHFPPYCVLYACLSPAYILNCAIFESYVDRNGKNEIIIIKENIILHCAVAFSWNVHWAWMRLCVCVCLSVIDLRRIHGILGADVPTNTHTHMLDGRSNSWETRCSYVTTTTTTTKGTGMQASAREREKKRETERERMEKLCDIELVA